MPFDGNCYLSKKAFEEIRTQLDRSAPDIKHFVVPMKRLLNNSELLSNDDEKPKATEEPQIIFRYDSTEEYNLNMRYGRRSKVWKSFYAPRVMLWLTQRMLQSWNSCGV